MEIGGGGRGCSVVVITVKQPRDDGGAARRPRSARFHSAERDSYVAAMTPTPPSPGEAPRKTRDLAEEPCLRRRTRQQRTKRRREGRRKRETKSSEENKENTLSAAPPSAGQECKPRYSSPKHGRVVFWPGAGRRRKKKSAGREKDGRYQAHRCQAAVSIKRVLVSHCNLIPFFFLYRFFFSFCRGLLVYLTLS